jgi:hypothetical protein
MLLPLKMAKPRQVALGLPTTCTAPVRSVNSAAARYIIPTATALFILFWFIGNYSSFDTAQPQDRSNHLLTISTRSQRHTSGLWGFTSPRSASATWGLIRTSLSGAYYGAPMSVHVWLRVLCAGNVTVARGFATAEIIGSSAATYDGVELLPDAITSKLPSLKLYLTDSTEQPVEQLYANRQHQQLRSVWHFQATMSSEVTIAAIGIPDWDVRSHLATPAPCSISRQFMQSPPWAKGDSFWSVVYLPSPSRSVSSHRDSDLPRPLQIQHTIGLPEHLGCSQAQADPLSNRVLRTLSKNKAAGVSGLILVSPDLIALQHLLHDSAIQEAVDSGELVLWLWVSAKIFVIPHVDSYRLESCITYSMACWHCNLPCPSLLKASHSNQPWQVHVTLLRATKLLVTS